MNIEQVRIDTLKPDPRNARDRDKKNIAVIKNSLKKFGQQKPIVVTQDNVVIAGNGTLLAAKALRWKHIAIKRFEMSDEDALAYGLVDNRSNDLSKWNEITLRDSLRELQENNFDVADIGFDTRDFAMVGVGEPKPPKEKRTIERRCHLGDVWVLGPSELCCGDASEEALITCDALLAKWESLTGQRAMRVHEQATQ